MEDYESQYEAYKQSILYNRWLRKELHEKYEGSLRVEKNYIDENGVLWKTSVISCVFGFCLSLFWILEDRGDTRSIMTRIILAVIMIVCCILGIRVAAKFKKDAGEMNFYAFRYYKHFEDQINEDRSKAMWVFEQDLSKTVDFMRRCNDKPSDDLPQTMEEFRCALHYVEALKKQHKEISNYDGFAGSIKNDYQFNLEIQKDIDKYI